MDEERGGDAMMRSKVEGMLQEASSSVDQSRYGLSCNELGRGCSGQRSDGKMSCDEC